MVGILHMIVFWALVVLAIAALLRWLAGTDVRRRPPSAREILEQWTAAAAQASSGKKERGPRAKPQLLDQD